MLISNKDISRNNLPLKLQIWVYNGEVNRAMKDCWLFPGICVISFPKQVYKKFIFIAENAIIDAVPPPFKKALLGVLEPGEVQSDCFPQGLEFRKYA